MVRPLSTRVNERQHSSGDVDRISQPIEVFGVVRAQRLGLPAQGMPEIQLHGVQCQAADRIRRAVVGLVSDYRKAALREMDADLMFSPGLESYLQQRSLR